MVGGVWWGSRSVGVGMCGSRCVVGVVWRVGGTGGRHASARAGKGIVGLVRLVG